MDKFPEAFRRFEKVVDVDSFESYRELRYAFTHWASKRWRNTYSQNRALAEEGWRLGYKDVRLPSFFGHKVKDEIRIKAERRIKDEIRIKAERKAVRTKKFSRKYSSYNLWLEHETRTTAYQRRIIRYMQKHPNASLREARGHRIKPEKAWKKRAKKYGSKKSQKRSKK